MLDSDLAKLYGTETKRINEAVRNNQKKFPDSFSWRLSEEESNAFLVENFDQKKIETRGGKFKCPRVFSERGIIMLSTILKSDIAIEMSIRITDAFVKMRHFIMENKDVYKSLNSINNKLIEHDDKIDYLFSKFDKKEILFSRGETFDAYYNVYEIINNATSKIIIIDNYADVMVLDLIKNIKCNVALITRDSDRLSNNEIEKYNSEYHNLKVIRNNSFHDRFLIIDNKEIFLCGSSFNTIGSKTSLIIKISDEEIIQKLLSQVSNLYNN